MADNDQVECMDIEDGAKERERMRKLQKKRLQSAKSGGKEINSIFMPLVFSYHILWSY